MSATHCTDCASPFVPSGCGLGYGTYRLGAIDTRVCYACCAKREVIAMRATGRALLYLTGTPREGFKVTNWPGSLSFTVTQSRKFTHPFSRNARIAYFAGPDGAAWSAKNIGDSDVAHCRKLAS